MRAQVVGWSEGRRIDVPVRETLKVGASAQNDLVLPLPSISGAHLRILRQDDGWWVEDRSRNGTSVNGARVKRAEVRHLDVISLAGVIDLIFVLRDGEEPAPEARVITRVVLEWLDGDDAGRTQEVPPGSIVFGRGERANIVLATGAVSRAHAKLDVARDGVALEDLDSANGTTVNGGRISGRVPLKDGDEFALGDERRFRVQILTSEAAPAVTVLTSAKTASSAPSADQAWRTRLIDADELPAMRIPSAVDAGDVPTSDAAAASPQTVYQSPNLAVPGGLPRGLADALAEPADGPVDVGGSGSAPGMPHTVLDNRGARNMVVPKLGLDGGVMSDATVAMPAPAMPPPRIQGVRLTGVFGSYTAGPGRSIVGRGADAGVRIDSRELSRVHAALVVGTSEVLIEDLGSTNGTTVNGVAHQGPVRLTAGDRVAFGTMEFAVEMLAEGTT